MPEKSSELGDLDDLQKVIDESAFTMHFQPIVDFRNRSVFAYEALCRPLDERFSSPIELISAAVETERIGELGRLQRKQAVKQCTGSALFLNLEPHEFDEPWLVRPDDPIFMHRHAVYLEITENVPLKYFDQCHSILAELRKKGTLLVIDDFGAGFSNLKYIAELEPDIVKLDRELIRGCEIDTSASSLLTSITALCHEMRAQVVAEGIETVAELEAVLAAGVDFGQGYLLARPGPEPAEIELPEDHWRLVSALRPAPAVKSRQEDRAKRTTSRETQLETELEHLNKLLVESEAGRLSLVRKLRESLHAPSPGPKDPKEETGPRPDPEASPAAVRSKIPGPKLPLARKPSDALLRILRYAALPLLGAFAVVLWLLWPTPPDGTVIVRSEAPSSASIDTHDPPGPRSTTKGARAGASTSQSSIGLSSARPAEQTPSAPVAPAPPSSHATEPAPRSRTPTPAVIVAERVSSWSRAWSARNVQEYLSFYSPDFKPATGASFREWVRLRRRRIEQPSWITVEITELVVSSVQPDLAIARFRQAYASPGYEDQVEKTMEWVKEGPVWRILSERNDPD